MLLNLPERCGLVYCGGLESGHDGLFIRLRAAVLPGQLDIMSQISAYMHVQYTEASPEPCCKLALHFLWKIQ